MAFDAIIALATEKAIELAAHEGAPVAHRHFHAAFVQLGDLMRRAQEHLVQRAHLFPLPPAASVPARVPASKSAGKPAETPKPVPATAAAPAPVKPAPAPAVAPAAATEGAPK